MGVKKGPLIIKIGQDLRGSDLRESWPILKICGQSNAYNQQPDSVDLEIFTIPLVFAQVFVFEHMKINGGDYGSAGNHKENIHPHAVADAAQVFVKIKPAGRQTDGEK